MESLSTMQAETKKFSTITNLSRKWKMYKNNM
jgi:hypothetical protein